MSTEEHQIEADFLRRQRVLRDAQKSPQHASNGEDVMKHASAALGFVLSFGWALSVGAQEPSPGRYSMQKSETGFARLDTETGEVDLCQEKNGELVCRMAADERAAFERELDLLTKRVEALERGVQSGATTRKQDLPTDEEIDRTMSIMERIMRKFMEIVKEFEGQEGSPANRDEQVPDRT